MENKDNSYKVRFAKTAESGNLASFEFGGYTLKWRLDKTQKSAVKETTDKTGAGTGDEAKTEKTASDKALDAMTTKNTKSALVYKEILPGIDLNYILKGETVKENIVLKTKDSDASVTFVYDFGGLEPKVLSDNSISLIDPKTSKETGLTIAAPYMYDANYEYSDAVKMTLEKQGKEYKITLTADTEWLSAKDREYPVVIDPTLQTSPNVMAIRDAFVCSDDPNSSYYNTIEFMRVANYNTGIINNMYIRYENLPILKPSDQVVDAKVVMTPFQYYSSQSKFIITNTFNPHPVIKAYQVTSMWYTKASLGSPVLTYNSQPSYNSTVLDYERCAETDASQLRDYSWNVTKAAKDWYRTGNNYGIRFSITETVPSSTWAACFASSDYINIQAGDMPNVVIT